MSADSAPSGQSYVHECGDGAYVAMTLSDGPPGHVYPSTLTLGACVLCGVEPSLLRATTPEYIAELDDEEVRDPSAPDTSQPYPLDALIERIDVVTSERRS